jgi:hypothetical protein
MVAWKMEMFTPEYPEGRMIIVIANDITFSIGSFGPAEDDVFFKASEYAREKGTFLELMIAWFLTIFIIKEFLEFMYLQIQEHESDLQRKLLANFMWLG